jgi:hypothetical protein
MSERESNGIEMRLGSPSRRSAARNWIVATAALAALVFGVAAPSWAQSASPSTQASTPKPMAEPGASAGQSAAKGQHEGIVVYGRWIIEVKNPDGKVVQHREFENSLTGVNGAEGSSLLAGLLSGVLTTGGWTIAVDGAQPACSPSSASCLMVPPAEVAFYDASAIPCAASATQVMSGTQPYCYGTLAETLTGASGNQFTSLTLTGTAYATAGTYLTTVFTELGTCFQGNEANSLSGTVVTPALLSPSSPTACSTSTALVVAPFTSFTLPSPGVPVTAGQTIEATVTFTFSSPQ